MTDVCPRCSTTYSKAGTCECDVDGIPPTIDLERLAEAAAAAGFDLKDWQRAIVRALHDPVSSSLTPFVTVSPIDREALELHLKRTEQCEAHLDGGVLCDGCGDALAAMLKAVPALVLDLNAQRAGVQGVDYRSVGGGKGGEKVLPLVINLGSITARDQLRRILRSLVVDCLVDHVRDVSPTPGTTPHRGDVPAMAEWLLWRVDGMALHPGFASAADAVAGVVRRALVVVDARSPGIDLGPCVNPLSCPGRMRASSGSAFAVCARCETSADAGPLRERALDRARTTSATAADIASLSSYLDVTGDRDAVRKRVNQWNKRGLLTPTGHDPDGTPRFLFGDVYDRLRAWEDRHRHSWSAWQPVPGTEVDPDTGRQPHTRSCGGEGCPETQTSTRKPDRPILRGA